jgi:hypothetical protein
MQKKISLIILISVLLVNIADAAAPKSPNDSSYCHGVIACGTGDSAKQTAAASIYNQEAYECYYKTGDLEMAKIASNATTRCQTMYGSLNPTIRKQ